MSRGKCKHFFESDILVAQWVSVTFESADLNVQIIYAMYVYRRAELMNILANGFNEAE